MNSSPPTAADAALQARAGDDPREVFERRLAREILAAERFRATLLAVIPTAAMLAFLAINAAYLLPTPGQLGVQEAAITVAFAAAGIAAPEALACALAYRCVHLVALGLVGVPALVATWLPQRSQVTA